MRATEVVVLLRDTVTWDYAMSLRSPARQVTSMRVWTTLLDPIRTKVLKVLNRNTLIKNTEGNEYRVPDGLARLGVVKVSTQPLKLGGKVDVLQSTAASTRFVTSHLEPLRSLLDRHSLPDALLGDISRPNWTAKISKRPMSRLISAIRYSAIRRSKPGIVFKSTTSTSKGLIKFL